MTLKPGAPGTRSAYANLAQALLEYADLAQALPEDKTPVHIGPDQPAILLYRFVLQERKLLTEDELHTLQDTLFLLTNLMDPETRKAYLEECSRIRRRDALRSEGCTGDAQGDGHPGTRYFHQNNPHCPGHDPVPLSDPRD